MPDIKKYETNLSGNDYIVGDIHGSNTAFKSAIDALGDHDRLFLVGDLTDRGPDSIAIIDMIIEKNKGKIPPMVYAVKGNHEEMLLDAISVLLDNNDSKFNKLLTFLYNGGEWIFKNEEDRLKIKEFIEPVYDDSGLKSYVKSLIAKEGIYDLSALTRIRDFIEPLPYIIRVGESKKENPFIVCHADLPFSDAVLDAMTYIGADIDDAKKMHLVWAREADFRKSGRNADSIRTYVGHNILESANDAVRDKTNTINLDFGAYDTGSLAVVNHTTRKVITYKQPLEKPVSEGDIRVIASAIEKINKYLRESMLIDLTTEEVRHDDREKALAIADEVKTKVHFENFIRRIKNVDQCRVFFSHLSLNGKIKEIYGVDSGAQYPTFGLMNKLAEPYRAVALVAMKDQIHEVVHSISQLAMLFGQVPNQYLAAVILSMKDKIISDLIKTRIDLSMFIFLLTDPDKKIVVLNTLKDTLPTMIHSMDDLIYVLSELNAGERSIVLNSMENHLLPLIKTENDLKKLRVYFTKPEQETNRYFLLLQKLFDIKKFPAGPNDTKLTACVDALRTKIKDLDKPGVFKALDKEFSDTLASVSSQEVVDVKQIIQKLRAEITSFTINKGGKALEIEQALCNIEPNKRGTVLTDLSNGVQTAILKGRITGKAASTKNFTVLREIKLRLQEHKSEKREGAIPGPNVSGK